MDLYKQPTKEQFEDIMDSFWTMLCECEEVAHREDARVLKHFVEGFYRQWNSLQIDNKNLQPRWRKYP